LAGASIRPHKFDPLRLDVVMGDQFFYIRVDSTQLRDDWVSDLIKSKASVAHLLGVSPRKREQEARTDCEA
jgi:hypothetical protein